MNVDVAVNGRPWKVAVEAGEQSTRVTVGVKGRKRVVDVSWVDADTLSLIDGSTAREVRISPRRDGVLGITFNGRTFEAVAVQRMGDGGAAAAPLAQIRAAAPPANMAGPATVKAPMPGRVVRILVTAGDRVKARQGVVVIEAMKMENELRSPRDGVVAEIRAVAGNAVEAGAVLVVIGD